MLNINSYGNSLYTTISLHNNNQLNNISQKNNATHHHYSNQLSKQASSSTNDNLIRRLDNSSQNSILSNCVNKLNITPMQIDQIHGERILFLLKQNKTITGNGRLNDNDSNNESSERDFDQDDYMDMEDHLEIYISNIISDLRNYLICELQYSSFKILSFYQLHIGLEVQYKQILAVIPFHYQ